MPAKMRSTTRPKVGALTVKALGAAVASTLIFANANAAALGKLTVLSALGQPLRAEIALRAIAPDEEGSLVAKLASADAFRQANVEFNPALLSLQFSIERRGDSQFIRVTSSQPLNEPFVDMLLELSSPDGRLIREYTFLLDPPDLRTMEAAQAAPMKVPGARSAQQQAAPAAPATRAAPLPAQAAAAAPAAGRGSHPASGEYTVKKGDTLAGIANQYRSGGVSLDQMLVALYRANPDAFIDNNMNRMKAGQILSVPDAASAGSIGNGDAHRIVVAQAADFNRYRQTLATSVANGAARQSAQEGQSAGGKITAQVEEKPTAANESRDKLKLSNALAMKGGAKGGADTFSAEDRIAQEKAIADANARIAELEKNVSDLEKIIELKSKALAEKQNQAAAASAPAAAKPATTPAKPAAAPAVKAKPPVHVAPPPKPGLIDELLDNPLLLPGLGALLVALGVVGIYGARRRKSKPFEDSILTDSSLKTNSLFGSTGGQSVDTSNSVFNSSFAPSVSQLDSNEVDPVAEADVYIAYGRDAQAEEILKEALRTQPERHGVRVKLLEIYSNRKDLRAFEVLATELYGMTKGEGDEWAQAAAMGAAIDPGNPLYAGGRKAQEPAPATMSASAPPAGPAEALDDPGLATLLATTPSDAPAEDLSGLETGTSYFSNSTLAEDAPLELPADGQAEPLAEQQSAPEHAAEPAAKSSSNELDFDLDGMMAELDAPAVKQGEGPAEPAMDIGSIDFDFLDTAAASPSDASAAAEPALELPAEAAAAEADDLSIPSLDAMHDATPEATHETAHEAAHETADDVPVADRTEVPDERAPLDFALPEHEVAAVGNAGQSDSDPLDFDLSDISLELEPTGSESASAAADVHGGPEPAGSIASASEAEMATKLDLALAYQEIGDKEGARELLDEVLKGGSAQQSERAKALLLELA